MFEELFIPFLSFLAAFLFILSMRNFQKHLNLNTILNNLSSCLSKLRLGNYREKIKGLLVAAGLDEKLSPDRLLSLGIVFAMGLFTIITVFSMKVSLFSVTGGFLGLYAPLIYLKQKLSKRHLYISRQLPYFADLLTISVEAGLDFNLALESILKRLSPGPLHEEFSKMLREIRIGKTRRQAMQDMRNRVNLSEFSRFIGALIQADTFGTSLARTLRIQSQELQRKRYEKAERKALQAPVKMLFPLIGFIFPAVFMILLGPVLLQMIMGGF